MYDHETGASRRSAGWACCAGAESGLSLEAYVEQVLSERSGEPSRPALTRSQLAGQNIRELRKSVTLRGISITELIDEGRE